MELCIFHANKGGEQALKVSVKNLRENLENKPQIPPFYFPSWDWLYIRDIEKLEKWIDGFHRAFDQFEKELREKLKEAQEKPSESYTVEILKAILGD